MLSVFLILISLVILYLVAIMPRMRHRPSKSKLKGWHYAHRGLHDNETEAPENSMAAFKKAVDAGYGIELDVQLTKDRIPVVFHDETLKRVCGVEGNVRDYTYEQLQGFFLCNSREKIPKFESVLKMINGRIPLIVEIKIHENANVVCKEVDKILSEYHGVYCIESFHPFAVNWYKLHKPNIVRGQLSSNFVKEGRPRRTDETLVHYLLTNFICKPDFIAYNHRNKNNISRLLCRHFYRALSVAWTIKSQEELDAAKKDFDLFIFEGFMPERPKK